MTSWLRGRDPERRPLMRPRMPSRNVSCGPSKDTLEKCDVFNTILQIRQDVMLRIDTPITWQGLVEPAVAFNLVRPLTEKYVALDNIAVVYCLLSNRLQFLEESAKLPNARLSDTRAMLCELLAVRVMTHYAKSTSLETHPTGSSPSSNSRSVPGPHASNDIMDRDRRSSMSTRSAAVFGARQRRMSMAEPLHARMAKKRSDELVLANLLIAGFRPFAGAPEEVVDEEEMEGRRDKGRACNALELAIVTEAKRFISCVACQKVLSSVWDGRIYYTPSSFLHIVSDSVYKQKAITIYDCRKAPLLDHYRLRVPRYRMLLETMAFLIVFTLMMLVLGKTKTQADEMSWWEVALIIYGTGWAFDRVATTLEHGWRVFAANLWNGIDLCIITIFVCYIPLRLYGVANGDHYANDMALSLLACESALLFPRLAFTFLKRNVLVMSLRAMLAQFGVLMMAAVWILHVTFPQSCELEHADLGSVGFWHALYTLDEGNYGVWEIAKYMTNIWFGLDATGFEIATEFHPWLGPMIFFIFACLANTLFLTVVVAILSHTFAELNQDSKAEYMFRHAVATVEGVKSDALFSFQPPLNLVALVTLAPASWVLTPRALHRTHVFFTRLANAPILLLITIAERVRHYLNRRPNLAETLQRALPKKMQDISLFVSGAHGDVFAVFDYAPDAMLLAKSRGEDAEYEGENEAEDEPASLMTLGNSDFQRWPKFEPGSSTIHEDAAGNETFEESEEESPDRYHGDRDYGATVPLPKSSVGHATSTSADQNLPRSETMPAQMSHVDGILATSPNQHTKRLQALGRNTKLQFDDRRRASYPLPEPETSRHSHTLSQPVLTLSPQTSRESNTSPLQQIYGDQGDLTISELSREGRRRSVEVQRAVAAARAGHGQGMGDATAPPIHEAGPDWARGLMESIKRMEERQARIEGLLQMAPGDAGD